VNGRQAIILLLLSSIFTVATLMPMSHVGAIGTLTFIPSSGPPSSVVALDGSGFTPEVDCWSNSTDFYKLQTTSGPMMPLQDAIGSCSVDPSGKLFGYFVVRTDALDGSYGLTLQGAATPFTVVVATTTVTTTTTTITSMETTTSIVTTTATPMPSISLNRTFASVGQVISIGVVGHNFAGTACSVDSIPDGLIGSWGSCSVSGGGELQSSFTVRSSAVIGTYLVRAQTNGGSSATHPFVIVPSTTVTMTTVPTTVTSTHLASTISTRTSTVWTATTQYTTTVTVNAPTYQTVYTGVSTVTSQYVQTINNYVTTVLGGTRTTYATTYATSTSYVQIPTTTGMKTEYTTATVQTHETLTDHTTVTETMPYIPPITTSQTEGNVFGIPVPSILAPYIGWVIPAVGVITALGAVGFILAVKKGRISMGGGIGQLIQGATGVQPVGVGPDLTEQPIPPESMVGEGATGEATLPPAPDSSGNVQQYCPRCAELIKKGETQCSSCHQRVSEPVSTYESEARAEELGKLQEGLGSLP